MGGRFLYIHHMMLHRMLFPCGVWAVYAPCHACVSQAERMYVCEAGSFFFFGELHGCFSLEFTELHKITWAEMVAQLSDPACMYVCMCHGWPVHLSWCIGTDCEWSGPHQTASVEFCPLLYCGATSPPTVLYPTLT